MHAPATTASCKRSHQSTASFGTFIMTSARTDDIRDALAPSDRSRVGWDRFVDPEGGFTTSTGPPSFAPPAASASKVCCNALSEKPANFGPEERRLEGWPGVQWGGGWRER